MRDPAPPDPPRPGPGASLEAYKPYLALFGVATAGVALLIVVGGIALAIFMRAGWVLVPLACVIWTLFPLRDLRELEGAPEPDVTPDAEGIAGDATGAAGADDPALVDGPGAGASSSWALSRRRGAWDLVRQRAVSALLITFTAWAALILLHLI